MSEGASGPKYSEALERRLALLRERAKKQAAEAPSTPPPVAEAKPLPLSDEEVQSILRPKSPSSGRPAPGIRCSQSAPKENGEILEGHVVLEILEDPSGTGYPAMSTMGFVLAPVSTTKEVLRQIIYEAYEHSVIIKPKSTRYNGCNRKTLGRMIMFVADGVRLANGADEKTLEELGMVAGKEYRIQWTPPPPFIGWGNEE